jgi:hypothetical protein
MFGAFADVFGEENDGLEVQERTVTDGSDKTQKVGYTSVALLQTYGSLSAQSLQTDVGLWDLLDWRISEFETLHALLLTDKQGGNVLFKLPYTSDVYDARAAKRIVQRAT